jgi:hypothetical protein
MAQSGEGYGKAEGVRGGKNDGLMSYSLEMPLEN